MHTDALAGKFFTFSQNSDDVYSLTPYTRTNRITSVAINQNISSISDNGYFTGAGNLYLNARDAKVIDLDTGDGVIVNSTADMARAIKDGDATGFKIAYIYNGADNNQGYLTVSTVFVLKTLTSADVEYTATISGATMGLAPYTDGTGWGTSVSAKAGVTVYVHHATPQYALTVDGVADRKSVV